MRLYISYASRNWDVCVLTTSYLFNCFAGNNALFDASQYAFFGQDTVEEVELGGLADEEDNDIPAVGFGDDEYHLFDREEVIFFVNLTSSYFVLLCQVCHVFCVLV